MCIKFRDLKASEIDCRIGQCNEKGLTLLLYKNARVDMEILDETVGPERWQREHYEVKGNMYCRVGIKFDSEWVYKSDCGTESNTEGEKGESSDSFKRANVCWGIGRELYTAPFIWVRAEDTTGIKLKSNGKSYACYDDFEVTSITIEGKVITALTITNTKTKKVCYTYGKQVKPSTTQNSAPVEQKPPKPTNEADLAAKRTQALNFKPWEGDDITLAMLRKNQRAKFDELRASPTSVECAEAIAIIDEWVASTRAQGGNNAG